MLFLITSLLYFLIFFSYLLRQSLTEPRADLAELTGQKVLDSLFFCFLSTEVTGMGHPVLHVGSRDGTPILILVWQAL